MVLRNFGSQTSNLPDFTCKVTDRCIVGASGDGAGDGERGSAGRQGSFFCCAIRKIRQIRESAFLKLHIKITYKIAYSISSVTVFYL